MPGTRTFVYSALLWSAAFAAEPKLQLSLTLDKAVYSADRMTATLRLRNASGQPVRLTFPSGQRFDLELRNERGDMVCRWSDGRAFTMALAEEQVEAGGERSFEAAVRLQDKNGKPLGPGKYTAVGWLTVSEPAIPRASAQFEIR